MPIPVYRNGQFAGWKDPPPRSIMLIVPKETVPQETFLGTVLTNYFGERCKGSISRTINEIHLIHQTIEDPVSVTSAQLTQAFDQAGFSGFVFERRTGAAKSVRWLPHGDGNEPVFQGFVFGK